METRSDDSPGSDYSLDKSLQKKCVVDDLGGQGEGGTTTCSSDAGGGGATIKPTAPTQTELSGGSSLANPAGHQSETLAAGLTHKTDQHVGDGGGGGGAGGGGLGCAGDVQRDYSDNNLSNCLNFDARHENDSSHEHDTASANSSSQQNDSIAATMSDSGVSLPPCNTTAPTTNNNNNNNATFETKVKQIAQNLKETSIAEQPAATTHTPEPQNDSSGNSTGEATVAASTNSSSSSSSSSSSTSSLEYEANASNSSLNTQADTGCSQPLELNVSMQSVASESQEDQRSKKVRFHPDVKENDGGNRVIPKKKKKLKNTPGGAGEEVLASTSAAAAAAAAAASTSSAQRSSISDDDMDMDDEDESTADEEEDFDLAKTIAEAEDYLKTHPLTFARAADKTSERMRNGLLDEEDLPQLSDSAEEEVEEMYDEITAENGVERILGKQTKAGKVEFLLRFVDRPGLHWEQEEFIHKMCPNLLGKYELCRERRQERLMGHVAKRQNIRQRYTDF